VQIIYGNIIAGSVIKAIIGFKEAAGDD